MSSPALVLAGKSPDAFRTISEVAADLGLPQHVLRFWESRFAQIKPVKRAGGRRYYRPEDIDLLRGIRALLHADGLTIRGAQKVLRERGWRHVAQIGRGDAADHPRTAKALEPVIVEKLVYVERPAPSKKRPTHLRAIPTPAALPLFEDESQMGRSAAVETRLAQEERARLQTLLAELRTLKDGLRKARKKAAISSLV